MPTNTTTYTGTYNYGPGAGDLTLQALARAGVNRTQVKAQHLEDAYAEANLMLASWSNKAPNLWVGETYTVSATAGTQSYILPPRLLVVQLVTINTATGPDLTIGPLSETEYAAIPNKTTQARPSSYWFDKQLTPTIKLWPVPEVAYTIKIRCLMAFQDVAQANNSRPAIPYEWLDAYCWGLAYRVAAIHVPAKAMALKAEAKEAFDLAASTNRSNSPVRFSPDMSGYFR